MNFLRSMSYQALRVASLPCKPLTNVVTKRFRKPSICNICADTLQYRPCFDINSVTWERGNACHAKMIRSFLYKQYWPREPSIVGLWMNLNSSYLKILTEKYSNTGDRYLAFERMERTDEKRLIGVLVANKIWPWNAKELEEWAHATYSRPEKHRMYFIAHCFKSSNLFKKYNVPYIFDVEILGSSADSTGQGVATHLLRDALHDAELLRHPLVQVISLGKYTNKICERCGMKLEWSMDYRDFVDDAGQRVFFPRRPHHTVSIYTKSYPLNKGGVLPCKPPF